ncbi:uncharacterized protein PRCAT00002030001 [Priceomyces carsonii]|uniref:uncharacterized protein n=1 Tax=Priceomyces carsonii TaxID=28549 RepID=UPI002ED81B66|nr:unnamed protein product [Priceomyces carsonii]
MSPPKKDAFADLFKSANSSTSNTSLTNLPLSERQKKNQKDNRNGIPKQNNWNDLDIFINDRGSGNTLSTSEIPRNDSPQHLKATDDPFSLFELRSEITSATAEPLPNSVSKQGRKVQESSLLIDDEFTDAFVSSEIEQPIEEINKPELPARKQSNLSSSLQKNVIDTKRLSTPESEHEKRDTVLAELVDIGFSLEVSNQAISKVGPDVQSCVNFIMDGSKSKKALIPQSNKADFSSSESDISARINEVSTDIFNKASFFLSKSKQTVMKNLEQFQHGMDYETDTNVPNWLKTQHIYKKDAIERRSNGEKLEDYGSDEENIDKGAIDDFIRNQKKKEKEKARMRYDNVKEFARSSMSSGRNSPASKLEQGSNRESQLSSSNNSKFENDVDEKMPEEELSSAHNSKQPGIISSDFRSFSSELSVNDKNVEEFDLIGFNESQNESNKTKSPLKTISTPLDQFQQSDYNEAKEKATELFSKGDYDGALLYYMKCLEALPPNHELRIVIQSNLSLNFIKLGNYKSAIESCASGLDLIDKNDLTKVDVMISGKPVKQWYIKLLSRKAESLEMRESFQESLSCYMELIQLGVVNKKIMDGKRRVNDIVKPKRKPAPASQPVRSNTASPSVNNENLRRLQREREKAKYEDELKFKLNDKIQEKVFEWCNGKEDNIRTLLTTLPNVLPSRLGFPFLNDKKITLNDLMLPKKVKISYMKVISLIHPDKIGNFQLEDRLLCEGVFITLNKSWDIFKEQNGMS